MGTARLAVVDQGFWALSNFVLVVLVARASSGDVFGLFGVVYSVVVMAGGLANAVGGEVLAVTRGATIRADGTSGSTAHRISQAVGGALGVILTIAVVTPVVGAMVAFAYAPDRVDSATAWVLVCVSPIAVVAEGSRSMLYAQRDMSGVAVMSSVRVLLQATGTTVLYLISLDGSPYLVMAWIVGGLGAMVTAFVRRPVRPRFRDATRAEWARRWHYGYEYVATSGPSHAMVFVAGGVLGLPAAGALRALQSVYGPLNMVSMGIRKALIPAVAEEPEKATRAGGALAASIGLVAVGATVVFVLIPEIGELLMSSNWPANGWVVGGFGVGRCAVGVVLGALIVHRAYDDVRRSSRLRTLSAVSLILPFAVGSSINLGVALWAAGVVSALASVMWWISVFRIRASEASSRLTG